MAELLETDRMTIGELVKKSSLKTVTKHNVSQLSSLINETPETSDGKSLYRPGSSKSTPSSNYKRVLTWLVYLSIAHLVRGVTR